MDESANRGAQSLADKIDGHRIGKHRLAIDERLALRPRAGWLYLRVKLQDQRGVISNTPVLTAIASAGGRGVKGWFEARLYPTVEFEHERVLDARAAGVEAAIVMLLGSLIPLGGHLMIDYESGGQDETFTELALSVPPPASYLGSLMFKAGCRGDFKDWYFSEGGHEGPRKLQANKSPDPVAARLALAAHRDALAEFLGRDAPADAKQAAIIARAQARARALLKSIGKQERSRRPTKR